MKKITSPGTLTAVYRPVSLQGFAKSILAAAVDSLGDTQPTVRVTRGWLYRRFGPRLQRAADLRALLLQVEAKEDEGVIEISTAKLEAILASLGGK